ncbi:MAG: PHB depolymerase family esterase [Alcaligenaceae bacterium]|nr:PHB depolymerase family esterase [Alcaligenaceae bacterium]
MAKRSRSKKSLIKASRHLFKIQQNIAKQAKIILPEQLKAANVLLGRPDPQKRGEWRKHVFIAPAFSDKKLVSRLDYYVFKPSPTVRHPDTKGMPLVVMLHGCQQDASVFAQGTQMNVIAQRNGFLVLYPQQSRRNHIANCWRWHDLSDNQGMAEAHSIMKIIHSTILMHGLDPQKVFIAGLSAGAAMAGILAASFPEQFNALAMHSGPVLGRAHDLQTAVKVMQDDFSDSDQALASYMAGFTPPHRHLMPTIILQGERDRIVHKRNAQELVKQFLYLNNIPLESLGITTRYHPRSNKEYSQTLYRDGRKRMLELIAIKRLDHAWAGGDDRLPFNSKYGPNSSQLIWHFFKGHLARSK